ncbi:MAG: hypothetical protein ABIK44_05850 [candidate division WOR-3 bacterium]
MENDKLQSSLLTQEAAIPLEYRYRTGLAASLIVGIGLVGITMLFSMGTIGLVIALSGLIAIALGMMGLVADPHGFIHSIGKRLIITDTALQEIDEKGQILWYIRPSEVKRVDSLPGRKVLPLVGHSEWRAEVWMIELRDGRKIRIPVWLLPGRGDRFKQRFESFLTFARSKSEPGTSCQNSCRVS